MLFLVYRVFFAPQSWSTAEQAHKNAAAPLIRDMLGTRKVKERMWQGPWRRGQLTG